MYVLRVSEDVLREEKGSRKRETKDRERSWTRCCCCWSESLLSSHTDEFRSFSSDFPAGLMTTRTRILRVAGYLSHKKLRTRKFPSFPERKNTATTKTTITITTTTRFYYSIPAHKIHRHDPSPRASLLLFGSRRNPHKKQTNKQTVLQTWEKTNPAVSQKPPERNPKSPDDTGEKKIIIIAVVVVVVAVMVM